LRTARFRNTLEVLPTPIIDMSEDDASPIAHSHFDDQSDVGTTSSKSSKKRKITGRFRKSKANVEEPPAETSPMPDPVPAVRMVAPRVSLPFVSIDRHIGARFSLNTLIREVQEGIPDLVSFSAFIQLHLDD